MNKISLSLILALSIFTAGCSQDSTGVVDTATVLKESNISKEAFARLEALKAEAAKEIASVEARMAELDKEVSSKPKFDTAAIENAIKDLQKKLLEEQEVLQDTVNEAIDEAIDKVKEEINLDKILPSDGSLDQLGEDVTKQVVDTLNQLEVELPPIPNLKIDLNQFKGKF